MNESVAVLTTCTDAAGVPFSTLFLGVFSTIDQAKQRGDVHAAECGGREPWTDQFLNGYPAATMRANGLLYVIIEAPIIGKKVDDRP